MLFANRGVQNIIAQLVAQQGLTSIFILHSTTLTYVFSCSLPCFKAHKDACHQHDEPEPQRVVASENGQPQKLQPQSIETLPQDPRLQQLLAQYPTLRSSLKRISDEPPSGRPGNHRDRGGKTFGPTQEHPSNSAVSPKRQLAHAMRLLDRELDSPSAEETGLGAFAALVSEFEPSHAHTSR